jgi:hypothetical protein
MEEKQLSPSQVYAVASIEHLISILYDAPDDYFEQIIIIADKSGIAEHKETMTYLYELFFIKGYLEHADQFAKKYKIETEKAS